MKSITATGQSRCRVWNKFQGLSHSVIEKQACSHKQHMSVSASNSALDPHAWASEKKITHNTSCYLPLVGCTDKSVCMEEMPSKKEKITAQFNLRSAFNWTPGWTNIVEDALFTPESDWFEQLKCTNDSHSGNFLNSERITDLAEEIMISTSAAASLPAVQSNQRALPRLVSRASAIELNGACAESRDLLFSPSFAFRETSRESPALNLLFATSSSSASFASPRYGISLSSPKSPELDPGGYLTTGTLRHCLSPDSSYYSSSSILSPLLDPVEETREAAAATWSSLLEGTIIGDKLKDQNLSPIAPPSQAVAPSCIKKASSGSKQSSVIDNHNFSLLEPLRNIESLKVELRKTLLSSDKIVMVSFKNGRSELFLQPEAAGTGFALLDKVIVEGDRGEDLGVISGAINQPWAHQLIRRNNEIAASSIVRLQEKDLVSGDEGLSFASWESIVSETHSEKHSTGIFFTSIKDLTAKRRILRMATADEVKNWRSQRQEESLAVLRCAAVVRSHRLPMTIIDAEYQSDRAKLTFYYSSSLGRVDFREMVRELFRIYKARIWMCSVSAEQTDVSEETANKIN